MFDEEYGKAKMEKFKEYCRTILGEKKSKNSTEYVAETKEYNQPLDIVSAYKALKQQVLKPPTIH